MEQPNQLDKHNFLYPRRTYRGKFTSEALVFNANLQEFAQKVDYICNLQTYGKISPEESFERINALWEQLKCSKAALGIGTDVENESGTGG